MKQNYHSPRWSGEILDCALPMTFDQYDHCSFNCLYCFSFYQKALKVHNKSFINQKKLYQKQQIRSVNPNEVRKIFTDLENPHNQFREYIQRRITFQWGGLADPFDNFEKRYGVGLELMEFFAEDKYPICFSTKGTWFATDPRYRRLLTRMKDYWSIKVSIINRDDELSKKIERGCPSPSQRIELIRKLKHIGMKSITLRLRPFIIGMSDKDYIDLIRECHAAGADSLSTEFFCLEQRNADALSKRYDMMSDALGFDIKDFYKRNSRGSGYLRLNYKIKTQYVDKMDSLCKELGMRFYVSDAHHKDKCANGCCCGLNNDWNYQRGQFTEMLTIAREREDQCVFWYDMEKHLGNLFKGFLYRLSDGFNTVGAIHRAKFNCITMHDWIKYHWNNPNSAKSPYKYFDGLLRPVGLDKDKNVVYRYWPYYKHETQ